MVPTVAAEGPPLTAPAPASSPRRHAASRAATAGDWVYEAPGEAHALVAYERREHYDKVGIGSTYIEA